ncbi:hypothetical protein [Ralstonia pseudosolanacearum]|uniref:hypothetical protein n=1 Tax=Ralstonia pseudosolanacearum TaxID=1310165 RepID=UPI00115FB33F|nr:hypothetical protein [Ralstonia pseudosolanacearum]MCL1618248.1 hypothetical protein [Ralstonia pseudosolanacearum CaRs-Mep]
MDEADRQALAKVLPKLPPLKHPMSDQDIASFTEAYAKLPNRPMWVPVLATKETILGRKIKRDRIIDRHIAAIRNECRAGQLVPVDANHAPLKAVEIGAHLTRKDAIAYLERHGLAYDDGETATSPGQGSSLVDAAHLALGADALALRSGTSKVGQPQFSPAKKAEIVKRSRALQAAGESGYRMRAAKEYDVSERSILKWVRAAEAKEKEEEEKKKPSWADLLPPAGRK